MNQKRINDVSAAVSALFIKKKAKKVKSTVSIGGKRLPNVNKKQKGNSIVQKALKQNKARKVKPNRNVTPPKAKPKSKTMAQMKRNLRLLSK